MRLRLSSRKSDLARIQTQSVAKALREAFPELEIECFYKESLGDINLTDPLWKIPEKGVFTEDFQHDLISGKTDAVVHSWKDLPTEEKTQTRIVATLPRADSRDLLLLKRSCLTNKTLNKLILFSSSPRRAHNLPQFLKEHLPFHSEEIEFQSVRGNIQTRVRKLMESQEVHGLILAKAAMDRLLAADAEEFSGTRQFLRTSLESLNWCVLPSSVNPNAAAQGAIAIEVLNKRKDLLTYFEKINDPQTYDDAEDERVRLRSFGGGCHQKIGISVQTRDRLKIMFMRGVSDQGKILDTHFVNEDRTLPRFNESEMAVVKSSDFFHRKYLIHTLAQETPLFVSHPQAVDQLIANGDPIWTAGLSTWKALAQKGIWVNGTSDGIGEEIPPVEILAGKTLHWKKLSHADAPTQQMLESQSMETANVLRDKAYNAASTMNILPTYELIPHDKPTDFSRAQALYWTSFKVFQRATQINPDLLKRSHFCGPGQTYRQLLKFFQEQDRDSLSRLFVVLDTNEWRRRCQI